jgi:hypothetical protein
VKIPIKQKSASFRTRLKALRKDKPENLKAALELLNERHFTIRVGSQHAVCDLTTPTQAVLPQKESEFKKRYRPNLYTDSTGSRRPLGDIWLGWRRRHAYDGTVVFKPPGATIDESTDDFNTWRGFRLKPCEGDWSHFRQHLKAVVCRGNDEYFDYLLKYFAHMVQYPGRLPGVALVVHGRQGTGKTIVYKMFELLFQPFNAVLLEDPKRVAGHFNSHLSEKILVCADEALFARDKTLVGKLKSTITAERMLFEAKFFDAVPLDNYIRLIILSNDEHIVHAAADERRYFVLEIADTYAQQAGESESQAAARRKAHFDPISNQMKTEGGAEAMMHDLRQVDLADFDPKVFPATPFLTRQKELSRQSHEKWWADVLDSGGPWFERAAPKPDVYTHYETWIKAHPDRHVLSREEIGRYLCTIYGLGISRRIRFVRGGPQISVYTFPELAEARRLWAEHVPSVGRKIRLKKARLAT